MLEREVERKRERERQCEKGTHVLWLASSRKVAKWLQGQADRTQEQQDDHDHHLSSGGSGEGRQPRPWGKRNLWQRP